MNRLFYNKVYLAGPIDYAKDLGVGWRKMIQEKLSDLDLIFLDPCHKPMFPGYEFPDLENHQRRIDMKKRGDWETLAREMRIIRSIDLRMSDSADWSIAHLDLNIYSTGTHEEITTMNRRKIPVLLHMEQGKAAAPDWIRGELPFQHIFDNWDELVNYVNYIAYEQGQIDTLKRWQFFNYVKLYCMDEIPLTCDCVAKINPEDYKYLKQWKWHAAKKRGWSGVVYYAERGTNDNKGRKHIGMHQDVITNMGIKIPKGYIVDHINGDTLDNRRENLQVITYQENQWKRKLDIKNKTEIKGVYYDPTAKERKFRAAIWLNNKLAYQKRFETKEEAAKAISEKRKELHGKFARDI